MNLRHWVKIEGRFMSDDGNYRHYGTSRLSEGEPQFRWCAHLDLQVTESPRICRITGRCGDIVPPLGIERPKDLQRGWIERCCVPLALWSSKCKAR